jgi:hypothetical protein
MTAEEFEYVKISQYSEGYALVEVCFEKSLDALYEFINVVEKLNGKGHAVASPKDLETKATNDNTKFVPVITVKGKGSKVVDMYISELERMKNEQVL